MAERKVLSKYFPPDFDPSKIKRVKRSSTAQQVVRLMAPFNMSCKSCGEYIYKGRKFNARKETVQGEAYYGIKIFRFYIKCTRCSAEITFKTDPKNTDYEMEHGATRNHEYWKDFDARKKKEEDPLAHFAEEERLREDEETGRSKRDEDPMASLEARQEEAQREMETLDLLQDLRTRNARLDRVDAGEVLERKRKREEAAGPTLEDLERAKAEEEDEELVKRYFSHQGSRVVKRAVLEQEPEPAMLLSERARALMGGQGSSSVPVVKKDGHTEATSSRALPSTSTSPPGAATSSAVPSASTSASTPAPSSTTSPPPPPTHTAKSAAMAGMAAMAAKKAKAKGKGNALGLVRKSGK